MSLENRTNVRYRMGNGELSQSELQNPESAFNSGFTLIEMLVSITLLSVVMVGVYTLYISQHNQSLVQEDVVEVQQNLRVAMNNITRDIRTAGFVIPGGQNPINALTDGAPDSITLNAASAVGRYARITSNDQNVNLNVGDSVNLSVDSLGSFDNNDVNNSVVRIIRPETREESVNNPNPVDFTVTAVSNTAACGAAASPCLTLRANIAGSGSITTADMIVRTGTASPGTYPNTIAYSVFNGGNCPAGQNCLGRNVNVAGNVVVAANITDLQFRYIMDGGAEINDPTGQLNNVRAIRVTVDGATSMTVADLNGNPRTRQLTTIVKIRNR